MNISRIDGTRYGAVFLSLPSLAATRPRSVRVPDGCIAHSFHTIHNRDRRGQLQWPPHTHSSFSHPRHFDINATPPGSRLLSTFSRRRNSTGVCTASGTNDTATNIDPDAAPGDKDRPVLVSADIISEMRNFIDYYDDAPVDEYMRFYQDRHRRGYAPPAGPGLTVSDKKEDLEVQTIEGDDPMTQDHSRLYEVGILIRLLSEWRRRPAMLNHDMLWEIYQSIPEPRIAYIPSHTRHELFAALAAVERKDQISMLRYFAVVADVKNYGLALTRDEWRSAMSFTARYVHSTSETELEAVLKLWRQMEKESNTSADPMIFNVLFDTASKAGKFALAEMVYQEMARRGFQYDRYHHTTLIHFFGLQRDSDGVRVAYREMVEAGEIIDTLVLNCVIASLIRCGEEGSAEYVYEKMKASVRNIPLIPPRERTLAKVMTGAMKMFTRVARKNPDMLPAFQKTILTVPDVNTFRILIAHYGEVLGDLNKVTGFLDEMSYYNVPLHTVIFKALFKSFNQHGGPGSDWSASALRNVFKAFLKALDSNAAEVTITPTLAVGVILAHSRFVSEDELLDIYEELRSRWKLNDDDTRFVFEHLKKLLDKPSTRKRYLPIY
ncbi:hypothetical protein GGS20DRAFT_569302 [Poronia punctata]|nr:hypothetical protein GGS20DRAFT_569302 [Poronia punctata]